MKRLAPLLLVVLLSAAAPFEADPRFVARLAAAGFKLGADGAIVRVKDGATIDEMLLERGGYEYDRGRLAYISSRTPVDDRQLPAVLETLADFGRMKTLDARQVGDALRQWGVPAQIDGHHLLNPDGTPTYFGFALYADLKDAPQSGSRVNAERLGQALNLYDKAFRMTFNEGLPLDGSQALQKARFAVRAPSDPAARPRAPASPSPLPALAAHAAASGSRSAAAIALERMERLRFHPEFNLGNVPLASGPAEIRPPSHALLPAMLRLADKLNGKPLTEAQQRWLIQQMPLGGALLAVGAPRLWRQGFTGAGVKIAIVDSGVAEEAEFAGRVVRRVDFLAANVPRSPHGTAVAYSILAVAPDAQLSSYRAFDAKGDAGPKHAIARAIDRAVADGNQIINMSFAGPPEPEMEAAIARAKGKGILFIAASGNQRKLDGVESPASAPAVLAVGGLDGQGRLWDRTSLGGKNVLLAPAKVTTLLPQADGSTPYANIEGTSLAAGLGSGASALVWQQLAGAGPTLGDHVEKALWAQAAAYPGRRDLAVLHVGKNPIDKR